MAEGVGTGIGIGIGEGLHHVADNLRRHYDRQREDREKQADALHTKGMGLASKLLESGYSTKIDPQAGGPILVDRQTGQLAQNAPSEVTQLFNDFVSTSKQARELFPAHEPNGLADHFRKFLGKPAGTSTPDKRAEQFSTDALQSDAAVQPNQVMNNINQIAQAYMSQNPNATRPEAQKFAFDQVLKQTNLTPHGAPIEGKDANGNLVMLQPFIDPQGNVTTKPVPGASVPPEAPKKAPAAKYESGELVGIDDPNTGTSYHAGNIDSAPKEIQDEWTSRRAEAEAVRKRKTAEEDKKNKEAEERQSRTIQAAMERQTAALNASLDKRDYEDAKKVVTGADNDYQSALDRMATMDKNLDSALKNHDQQAMLSLVANHIGMTLGAQKGSRINQAVWNEAIQSAPFLARVEAKFDKDGYLSGVTLAPEQMHQMVELAHQRVDVLKDHKDRVTDQYHDALSVGTRKPKSDKPAATPAASPDDPLGILK